MAVIVARVDIDITNNAYWDDQFQFGVLGDTSWSFTGCSFLLDVKPLPSTGPASLSLSSAAATIVVDDPIGRVLHFYVPDTTIIAQLPVGMYYYDLIMVAASGQRDPLMWGKLKVIQGVTFED